MQHLFSPITIGKETFKHRLMLSPMCMYSSTDGFANDFHMVHLGSRAIGGFSLIIQEATAVSPEGRITYKDMGIWKDDHIYKLKEIVRFIHQQGSKVGIQLAHAGRKASTRPPYEGRGVINEKEDNGWKVVAPSSVPFREGNPLPIELDTDGINKIKSDFREATKRAKEVGYDVVEIHAAHGYLLHQFLSPVSNKRKDKYGGSLENRMRLLLETTEVVKKEWGKDYPLFVRISATDWVEGGWTLEDSIALAKELKQRGVDLIDVSSSGSVPRPNIPVSPGYQVALSEAIKKNAGIKTGAVGLITSQEQADTILQNNKADAIFIGREALRNPYFPLNSVSDSEKQQEWIKQYAWAIPKKEKSIP